MDAAARALAPAPLHAARIILLNESLDSSKVLLSKVFHPYFNIRYPLLRIVKERREKKRCGRFTLVLIAAPSTSQLLSQEVLKNALILLPRRDLLAASSVCLAWRPITACIE
jgi:radical SAM superfamily enzyme YgiQ (UPF0313 family)